MYGIRMAFAPLVTFSRAPIVLVVNQVVDRPVAVATGRALQRIRLDAHLDPPLADPYISYNFV